MFSPKLENKAIYFITTEDKRSKTYDHLDKFIKLSDKIQYPLRFPKSTANDQLRIKIQSIAFRTGNKAD